MAKKVSGTGTIRQRADGRWEGRYTSPKDRKQKSVYGERQKEVRQKLTEIMRQIDEGEYGEPSKLKLSSWMDTWLKEYVKGVKPHTVASYDSITKVHIKPDLGNIAISKLSVVDVQRFINSKAEYLSPKTVKNIHGVLHKALDQAIECEIIKKNVADRAKLPRLEKPEIMPFDDSTLVSFMEEIKSSKFGSLYLVGLLTGMRQSEMLGLRWADVDIKAGVIIIRRQLQHRRSKAADVPMYYFTSPKNGKERRIVPAQEVIDELKKVKLQQNKNRLAAGEDWIENDICEGLVFRYENGDHYRNDTVRKEYKAIVARIGAPEERFHDLRHTYAVSSLRAGDDIKTVQENLGHHSAAFTLDKYAHVTEDMRKESAARMQSFINSLKNNSNI